MFADNQEGQKFIQQNKNKKVEKLPIWGVMLTGQTKISKPYKMNLLFVGFNWRDRTYRSLYSAREINVLQNSKPSD